MNMKLLILYFSGTGNTKFIGNRIGKKLSELDHDVTTVSVENFDPKEVEHYDFLVFGYPIYGLDMPNFLKDYVNQLTVPKTQGVSIYCTMGYDGGNSLRTTGDMLTDRGFIVVHTEEFKMPGSDGLAIVQKDSKTAQKVNNTDYKKSEVINAKITDFAGRIDDLSAGTIEETDASLPKKKFIYRVLTPITRWLFTLFESIFIGKFRADEKCIDCGLCEEICPADNIVVNSGKVEFNDNCYDCLRCLHQCPVEAIQITKFTEGKFRYKGPDENYKPAPLVKNNKKE